MLCVAQVCCFRWALSRNSKSWKGWARLQKTSLNKRLQPPRACKDYLIDSRCEELSEVKDQVEVGEKDNHPHIALNVNVKYNQLEPSQKETVQFAYHQLNRSSSSYKETGIGNSSEGIGNQQCQKFADNVLRFSHLVQIFLQILRIMFHSNYKDLR